MKPDKRSLRDLQADASLYGEGQGKSDGTWRELLLSRQPRRARSRIVSRAAETRRLILLVAQRDPLEDQPTERDLHQLGTAAMIMRMLKLPDGRIRIRGRGLGPCQDRDGRPETGGISPSAYLRLPASTYPRRVRTSVRARLPRPSHRCRDPAQ